MKKLISLVLCVILVICACVVPASAVKSDYAEIGTKGTFSTITYNVAGLPIPSTINTDGSDIEGVLQINKNGKDIYLNTQRIGEVLNTKSYDIISTQEDFNYDTYLRQKLTNYNFMTEHKGGVPLGDGLNIFTKNFEIYNTYREKWEMSGGGILEGDCLTEKGFMVTTIKLADGVYLDYYDLHADAFDGEESIAARESNFAQLVEYIQKHSANRPIIITGDFNTSLFMNNYTDIMSTLVEPLGLNDAWAVKYAKSYTSDANVTEFRCDDNCRDVETVHDYTAYYNYINYMQTVDNSGYWGVYDSVERFFYRDGGGVKLSVDSFSYDNFLDTDDETGLSDHAAAIATFSYEVVAKPYNTTELTEDTKLEDQEMGFIWKMLKYIASIFSALGALFSNMFK